MMQGCHLVKLQRERAGEISTKKKDKSTPYKTSSNTQLASQHWYHY